MTQETYENLMRVQMKRQRQGAQRGHWNAVSDASLYIARLNEAMAESISPTQSGHPDNPFLSNDQEDQSGHE